MATTTLELTAINNGDLTILLEAMTDGEFLNIAEHKDLAIKEGSSAIGSNGDRPVLIIKITFDELKPETIEALREAYKKICDDVVGFSLKIK